MARMLAELFFEQYNEFSFVLVRQNTPPPKTTTTIVYKHSKIQRFKQILKLVNRFPNTPFKTITTIEATHQPTLIVK